MEIKRKVIQILDFKKFVLNKKYYYMPSILICIIIYFFNNAFCIFYDTKPHRKMREEGVMLARKIKDVLINNSYCKDYNDCTAKEIFFFDVTCSGLQFDFYRGITIDEPLRKRIVSEITNFSTYKIDVVFYDDYFETGLHFTSFPSTTLNIKRKKQ